MSDIGLYGSVYEQLRTYADKLDRALVSLKNPDTNISNQARRDIILLLRELSDKNSTKPTSRFVAVILKQELSTISGQGFDQFERLANSLDKHPPTEEELGKLEQLAVILDKECTNTLSRIKGRI